MSDVRAFAGVPTITQFAGITAPSMCAPLVVDSTTGFLYSLKTGDVVVLAGGGAGTVTSIDASGGTTGLSFTGGPVTASGTLTLTGTLAVANGGTGITAFGTGVATALGVNVGSAGAFVTFNGAIGTPSSGTVTNFSGTFPAGIDVTSKTGTGTTFVMQASPTLTTPKSSTTIGVGNATPSASGAGISFPATQSASTDANTLDDYEEGTWTPTDGSGAALTFTGVNGTYTKIGNRTWEAFQLTYPVTADASAAVIASFPFTAANLGSAQQGSIGYSAAVNASRGPKISNTTTMALFTSAGASTTNLQMSASQINAIGLSHVA